MSPVRRAAFYAAIAIAGISVVGILWRTVAAQTLPMLTPSHDARLVGAFHLHSNDSHDSNISVEDFAAAAHDNNLDFIVLTDHNKQKPGSLMMSGVTVLSYAELSTVYGHVVGLGASYTLDRTLRDDPNVLLNIRAAGGTPIVTHPSDVKRPWDGPLDGAGGLEIANVAAAARRAASPGFVGLLPLLAAWPIHPTLALAQLYDRDDLALARWDSQGHPTFAGICGTDAHGWIDPALNMQAWYVVVDAPVAAENRASGIIAALQQGAFHCVAGLLGRNPVFAFSARRPGSEALTHPGESVNRQTIDELAVTAPSSSIGPSQIVLFRNGIEVNRTVGNTLVHTRPEPGVYRTEIRVLLPYLIFGRRWAPVIYSNRIRIMPATNP